MTSPTNPGTSVSAQIPAFAPADEVMALAQLADELGYESVNCSHIAARDSFALLSGIAMVADSLQLGTAVAPIYPRSPASTAQLAATVDDVSGGRFRLGLGVGHRQTMGAWHGQEIDRPVAEMREYVGIVRALLVGDLPPVGKRWRTSFAFTGFTPRPDIPIYLAGLSPVMLRLAGEIADGVLLWACPAAYVRDVVVPEVQRGRERAGRDLEGFAILPAVPSAAGGDRGTVLAGVRSEMHRYFGLPFYRAMFAEAGFADALTAYDSADDAEAQRKAIPEEFVEALCALGDAAAVRAGVERYRHAGATNPVVTQVWGTDFAATLRAAVPVAR